MHKLKLKPTYKVVKDYYTELDNLMQLSLFTEGAVSPTFAALLRHCARQFNWTLAEQFSMRVRGAAGRTIRVDGALLDPFKLVHGVWEAKDSDDDLKREVDRKFETGYPQDNTLFQAPDRAILWQDGYQVWDADITQPPVLVDLLQEFFAYQPPAFEQWERAVEEFKLQVPNLAAGLLDLIRAERRTNLRFIQAFDEFAALCRQTINPNLSTQAVEEMLIQHLLTERIFRKVFDNPEFADRNIIAREIEKVILALTSQHFSRHEFLRPLDRFYGAIEETAATIDDYAQKQSFLNTVYEKFFQGFSIKVADTHGIVYTPQPIVDFMVRSIEDILQKEFGRSLSDEGVHVLDPFVGTGNFILRVMRQIRRSRLPHKYAEELHCNEVMLLPYYIAAMNIEHEYYELTGAYQPFEGICLVDTFELAEGAQLSLFTEANTERVERQKAAPIFVILGNPPYNAHQVNENDNSKNRKYPVMDRRVAETYAADSTATNKNALSDVYVKAIRWATDRIGDEGIVAYVSNNSFVDDITFDGMRKHLGEDFNRIYVLDLKGNIRKDSMRDGIPLGENHTVFGLAAMVGISVTFFVRGKHFNGHKILYSSVDFRATRAEKFELLEQSQTTGNLEWQEIEPDKNHTWLTEGLQNEFETFLPMGSKAAKAGDEEAVFANYGRGVATCRDAWAYNFSRDELAQNIRRMIQTYDDHVARWSRLSSKPRVDDFVLNDPTEISWSEGLKNYLKRQALIEYDDRQLRRSTYRPFTAMYVYFDKYLAERRYQFPSIYPIPDTEGLNRVICVTDKGSEKPFMTLMTDCLPDLHIVGAGCSAQCFPFYTYDEDGTNRRENITDWALARFREHYGSQAITKWDIFHYVYALLHHPDYRETYAANLRRELPRIPFAPAFGPFAAAGAGLAELHVGYEDQPEYPLTWLENNDVPLSYRVEKMRLSRDKTQLVVNDFLTLAGIPPQTFDYRLGNRSALDWIIDRYRVRTDKRSGIVNDPNRPDDPQYIVRLVGKVITVSLETVKVVEGLPELE
jgi:predicted helicase